MVIDGRMVLVKEANVLEGKRYKGPNVIQGKK